MPPDDRAKPGPTAAPPDSAHAGTPRGHPRGASPRRARALSLALVAALTLAGLAYSLMLGGGTRFPDERDYLAVAASLAHEGVYSYDGETPNAMRPPGYPVLLGPVAAVAAALAPSPAPADGSAMPREPMLDASGTMRVAPLADAAETALTVHIARTLQFLALGLSALALASLAGITRRTTGRTPGTAAPPLATPLADGPSPGTLGCAMVLGLAGYPVLVYTAGTLFPQIAVLALATAALWLLERVRPGAAGALGVGLACGAAVEVSPTALTLVPVALLHAALSPRWRARHVLLVALGASLLPGAWLVRNHVVLDETILFSRNLAYNLDNAVLELDPTGDDAARVPDDAIGYGTERLEQLMCAPGAYLERLGRHFAWRNDMQVTEESSRLRDTVMLVSYAALLGLVGLRLAFVRRAPLSPAERSVLLLYLMTAAFHALVFVRIRYRVPFDFLLFLPALNGALLAAGHRYGRTPPSGARRA